MGRSTGAWGSEERFATLFERTYQRVHAVARRRVGETDADDLVSETFMVALRRRHEIPSDVDEALLWLYKVTINTAANKVRGDRRRAALIEHLQQGGETRMQNPTAVDGTEAAALADAFLTLSEPAREIRGRREIIKPAGQVGEAHACQNALLRFSERAARLQRAGVGSTVC